MPGSEPGRERLDSQALSKDVISILQNGPFMGFISVTVVFLARNFRQLLPTFHGLKYSRGPLRPVAMWYVLTASGG